MPFVSKGLLLFVGTVAFAAPLQAQQPATDTTVYKLRDLEVITASGRGKTRGANGVDSMQISRMAPAGTSALRVVEQLPGVNVQSADPFGTYEWSTRVTIRGFQTQQIGQTLDGVPLGDMSYGNFNGLNIARAVDAPNLAGTTVDQGSGALGTASANNLGGVIEYRSNEPADHQALRVQQMAGGANSLRTYARVDLGAIQLGNDSRLLRGFVSLSNTSGDKWKGGGQRFSDFPGNHKLLFGQNGLFRKSENWQDQLNVKLQLLSSVSKITAFYDYSDKKESDYMDLSLSVLNDPKFGAMQDYWTDWPTAKKYAELALPPYNPLGDVAYFYSAQGARQDHLGYVRADLLLGVARLAITPYVHENRGGGDWHAPSYGASYSPDPIMFRQSQYKINRQGVTASIAAAVAGNELEAGAWYESNNVNIRRPRWRLVDYQRGPEVNFQNVLRLDFDRTGDTKTGVAFIQNTNHLTDALRVTYGVKYLGVNADFRSNGNTPTNGIVAPLAPDAARPSLSLPTRSGLLPQAGAVLKVTATEELFGNYSENVNQFPYSPQGGVYNAAPQLFTVLSQAKPERASSVDVGVRTHRSNVEGSLAVYYVGYRNRLLGISLCPPTVSCATGLGNVGSVKSTGAEGLIAVDVLPSLKWRASGSYNASTFSDDYLSNQGDPNSVVRTRGKDVQDSPRWLLNTGIEYANAGMNAGVSARYVDKRFFTYTNDLDKAGDGKGFVPSYGLVDVNAGYRFERAGPLKGAFVQVNVKNILDRQYVSSIGTNGFTTIGDNQTLLAGPRRLLFVSTGFDF